MERLNCIHILPFYDVIIAIKSQDLDLRNQTTPCGCESGRKTSYQSINVSVSQKCRMKPAGFKLVIFLQAHVDA